MTSDGADFAAAAVALTVLAVVEAPVPELPPQPASAAAKMASAPTMHFVDIRFTFHSLGRLIRAHDAAGAA
jgi:putative flippase GtrA